MQFSCAPLDLFVFNCGYRIFYLNLWPGSSHWIQEILASFWCRFSWYFKGQALLLYQDLLTPRVISQQSYYFQLWITWLHSWLLRVACFSCWRLSWAVLPLSASSTSLMLQDLQECCIDGRAAWGSPWTSNLQSTQYMENSGSPTYRCLWSQSSKWPILPFGDTMYNIVLNLSYRRQSSTFIVTGLTRPQRIGHPLKLTEVYSRYLEYSSFSMMLHV